MPVIFPDGLAELNGGLQIYRPSRKIFERILKTIEMGSADEFPFSDQDVLSKTFYMEIGSYISNALEPMRIAHSQIWREADVKAVHYLFEKPWDDPRGNGEGPRKWWRKLIKNDSSKRGRKGYSNQIGLDDIHI